MKKKIKIIKKEETLNSFYEEDVDLIFKQVQKDTIGKSSSNPIWGYIYTKKGEELESFSVGLYKEFDYDVPRAAFSEKIYSILGKKVLKGVRVPDIDIVEETKNQPGIISYRLLDNDKEDMMHITDILFNKFEREDFKKCREIFKLQDILESLKLQVKDENNYKELEKNVVQTVLLDAVTNNCDRHINNWALIRNKETSYYELACYDHSASFLDILEERRAAVTRSGWTGSYLRIDDKRNISLGGEVGDILIKYISENYTEHYEDFCEKYDNSLEDFFKETEEFKPYINYGRLKEKMLVRRKFLKGLLKERGDKEYGE